MKSPKRLLYGFAYAVTSLWQKRKLLLLALFLLSFFYNGISQTATPITVSGIVKDSSGVGMPNVTVTERGKKNATSTSADGAFTINVAGPNSILVFSSIGFSQQELVVGTQTNLTVSLQAVRSDLSEVVVIGYGSRTKQSLTGAISTVTSKDLDRVHGGATVSSGLAGKIPGVSFLLRC